MHSGGREKKDIVVRNPYSIRPYQHVLEPLAVYLTIAKKQYEDITFADFYNVGPSDNDCITTGELVDLFCLKWGEGIKWINQYDAGPHEASFLKLDCSKLRSKFDWKPRWNVEQAVEETVEWAKVYLAGESIPICMDRQIEEFFIDRKVLQQ